MTEFERDTKAIDYCLSIIDQESKPLKRKPGKASIATMAIDRKRDRLDMAKLCNTDVSSDLKEFAKTL